MLAAGCNAWLITRAKVAGCFNWAFKRLSQASSNFNAGWGCKNLVESHDEIMGINGATVLA